MKYNQLNQLVANLNAVIGSQESRTQKKLFRIYEKLKSHHEAYQAEVEGLRLDNAQVDSNDCLILDEKNGCGLIYFIFFSIGTRSSRLPQSTR